MSKTDLVDYDSADDFDLDVLKSIYSLSGKKVSLRLAAQIYHHFNDGPFQFQATVLLFMAIFPQNYDFWSDLRREIDRRK